MKYLKIFGLERVGAGYLMELLKRNVTEVEFLFNVFGAHYELPKTKTECKLWLRSNKYSINSQNIRYLTHIVNGRNKISPLIIIKDPYSWSKSIWRCRRTRTINYEEEYYYYNAFYTIMYDLITDKRNVYSNLYGPGMFIKYEEVLEKPFAVLARIRKFYKLERIGALKLPEKIEGSNVFTEKSKNYYLSNGPFKLSELTINKITHLVDWDLITNYYGYYPMNPLNYYDYSRQERTRLTSEMVKNGTMAILDKYHSYKRLPNERN